MYMAMIPAIVPQMRLKLYPPSGVAFVTPFVSKVQKLDFCRARGYSVRTFSWKLRTSLVATVNFSAFPRRPHTFLREAGLLH